MFRSTLMLVAAVSALHASAVPHVSKATSTKGAIAYQDHADASQFWYVPTTAPVEGIGGASPLKAFTVNYSGIGPPYFDCVNGICRRSYGANVAATVNIDLTDKTRKALIKEIASRFNVPNPKLAPVRLSNVKAKSLLVDSLSIAKISQNISTAFQFKQDVGFTAGSLGSSFGANLATTTVGVTGIVPNPMFQVEFVGEVEFAADPWIVEATCDLTQVWSHVRESISASANLGWFSLGQAQYESIVEELKRTGICSYKEVQGTLDVKNDILPALEMIKKLFEEMNAQAAAGEGFFKFEPNPEPAEVSAKGATSTWPWSVSVNAGYSSASFTQNLTKTIRAEIQARFKGLVGTTVVMAVKCTPSTKAKFTDLGDPSEPCITPKKVKQFTAEAAVIEAELKSRLAELSEALIEGRITLAVYNQLRQDALQDAGGTLVVETQRDGKVRLISTTAAKLRKVQ